MLLLRNLGLGYGGCGNELCTSGIAIALSYVRALVRLETLFSLVTSWRQMKKTCRRNVSRVDRQCGINRTEDTGTLFALMACSHAWFTTIGGTFEKEHRYRHQAQEHGRHVEGRPDRLQDLLRGAMEVEQKRRDELAVARARSQPASFAGAEKERNTGVVVQWRTRAMRQCTAVRYQTRYVRSAIYSISLPTPHTHSGLILPASHCLPHTTLPPWLIKTGLAGYWYCAAAGQLMPVPDARTCLSGSTEAVSGRLAQTRAGRLRKAGVG